MAKCVFCAGEKTGNILEKLDYNVGGIELSGCKFTDNLQATIQKSGRINKVLIFQTAILNNFIPQILYDNKDFEIIFVLDDEELMQKLDIDFYGNSLVQIVKYSMKKITFPFIRELISATKLDEYLLYKGPDVQENIDVSVPEEPEEQIEVGLPNEINTDKVDYVRKNSLNEDENNLSQFDLDSLQNNDIEFNTPTNPIPERKTVIQKEEDLALKGGNVLKEPKDQIAEIISNYTEHLVLLCTGTTKSYTSTTAFNIASYLAKNDITVELIDLDNKNCSQMIMNKKVYGEHIISNDNSLLNAIRTCDPLKNYILLDTNLHCLTNHILKDSLDFNEQVINGLGQLIQKCKEIYKVIIMDCPLYNLDNIPLLTLLFNTCNRIFFNINYTNKDLITMMRLVEFLQTKQREDFFKKTSIIGVNNTKKKLLGTGKTDLAAIDSLLASNSLINALKYENIPVAGYLLTDKEPRDLLETEYFYNISEIENIILKGLRGLNG